MFIVINHLLSSCDCDKSFATINYTYTLKLTSCLRRLAGKEIEQLNAAHIILVKNLDASN